MGWGVLGWRVLGEVGWSGGLWVVACRGRGWCGDNTHIGGMALAHKLYTVPTLHRTRGTVDQPVGEQVALVLALAHDIHSDKRVGDVNQSGDDGSLINHHSSHLTPHPRLTPHPDHKPNHA